MAPVRRSVTEGSNATLFPFRSPRLRFRRLFLSSTPGRVAGTDSTEKADLEGDGVVTGTSPRETITGMRGVASLFEPASFSLFAMGDAEVETVTRLTPPNDRLYVSANGSATKNRENFRTCVHQKRG
jgi:hypothetical protein